MANTYKIISCFREWNCWYGLWRLVS